MRAEKILLRFAAFAQIEAPHGSSSDKILYLWLTTLILLPVCFLLADLESLEIAAGARSMIGTKPPPRHV